MRTRLYVGTYTPSATFMKNPHGKGIYTFEFNTATGRLTALGETECLVSPSYLAIDSQRRWLYATGEVEQREGGQVSAYAMDPGTGGLTLINQQPTLGGYNAFMSLDRSDHYLFSVNYGEGQGVVMFPIREDGGLAPTCFSVEHQGTTGPVAARQERSHAHCALADPNNRYVLVSDLGIDKIMVYRLDAAAGRLIPNDPPGVSLAPGAGPRHLVFHPGGRFVYLIQELNSTLSTLAYDSARGSLAVLQTVPTLPVGYSGESYCSAVHITPDGRFLYGGNRGHDSLAIYAIDPTSGWLTYVGHQPTGGEIPRDFCIDPTGRFLIVGNQNSDTLVTFRIHPDTGSLEAAGPVVTVPTPTCLKMIPISDD